MKIRKKIRLKNTLIIGLLCLFNIMPKPSFSQEKELIHEVKQLCLNQTKAFNDHDVEKFMNSFHEDIEMHIQMTGWLRGKPAVRNRFISVFKGNPEVKMEITETNARIISPNTIIVDFKWVVYPNPSEKPYQGTTVGVYVKRDGKWGEVFEMEEILVYHQ